MDACKITIEVAETWWERGEEGRSDHCELCGDLLFNPVNFFARLAIGGRRSAAHGPLLSICPACADAEGGMPWNAADGCPKVPQTH